MGATFSPPEEGWLVSLPQYDLAPLRTATDGWWAGIARHLHAVGIEDVPETPLRSADAEADWRAPRLLLTQTCGYPLMTELRGHLSAVATPIYACEGCEGARYRSALVVRDEETGQTLEAFRGRRVAANNPNSQSGMNVLRHMVAPLASDGRFFDEVVWSGGHVLSIQAVREGRADIAAIDAVTLALTQQTDPTALSGIRILEWSPAAPSLPYAVRHEAPTDLREAVLRALLAAVEDPTLAVHRDALLIDGFVPSEDSVYEVMPQWAQQARQLGYPELA